MTTIWPMHQESHGPPASRAEMIRSHLDQARQLGELAVEDLLVKIAAAQAAAAQVAALKGAVGPGVLDLAARAAGRYEVDVQAIQSLLAMAPKP